VTAGGSETGTIPNTEKPIVVVAVEFVVSVTVTPTL
jgi:hypothetical protein